MIRDLALGAGNAENDIADAVGKAAAKLDEIVKAMDEAKAEDTARWQALNEERKAQAVTLSELQKEHEKAKVAAEHAAVIEETKKLLANVRTPSKAELIGFAREARSQGYTPGTFISAITTYNNPRAMESERMAAKATLEALGSRYMTPEDAGSAGSLQGKAITGLTDATGGWVMPNAIVDDLVKTGRYASAVTRLVTRRTGLGGVASVDVPFRSADATRAAVITWNALKDNITPAYNGYTATLYTLARIIDVTNQSLRKSAGAIEADVLDDMARAFADGESYYILQGTGSSEPYGLQTAITNAPGTFTSTTVAAAATRAGSMLAIIANLAGTLAGRNRTADGALLSPSSFWSLASQGTENAGFFLDPTADRTAPVLRAFGIPVYPENNLAGSDDLIVGEFAALKVYYGDGLRIDSSSVANTRWDYNLTGFRGEMELGLDARASVYTGAFQFQADIVP